MKFRIRYADRIVGVFALIAIIALIFVIFMLGSKQRWFARDYVFNTSFDSANGASVGMPLQYKGFTIGKITSLRLNDDNQVDVTFVIYDTYYNRAKKGSLVELVISPIGLGNQFLFYPGNSNALLTEKSFIPRADTVEGQDRIAAGLVTVPKRDDTIANLLAQINPLLSNLNSTIALVNGAFNGTGKGPLAETMQGASKTLTHVSDITDEVSRSLDGILTDVKEITANLENFSTVVADPTGLVPRLIDPDGTLFSSIGESLTALEGTLDNVENASSLLASQTPQIAQLITEIHTALSKAQDVLEALRNNPILKNGVPERVQTDSSGINSRNIDF